MNRVGRKADIAVTTIAVLFITIISILLLLSLFGMKLPGFAKDIYCKTIFVVFRSGMEEGGEADTYCSRELLINVNVIEREQAFLYDFADGGQVKRLQQSPAVMMLSVPKSALLYSYMTLKTDTDTDVNMILDPGGIALDIALLGDEAKEIYFSEELNGSLMSCTADPCLVNISLDFLGTLKVYDLNISYEKCFVENQIIASMLACWKKAGYGKYAKDIMCDELSLLNDCPAVEVNETIILNEIKKQGLDKTLPEENTMVKLRKVSSGTNLLVEYSSKDKLIRVS
ncbi:hypothetical protein JXA85_06635 [Candidatus Woesearchaeota archaeon]|nr:hypothetical protein [Candidatus Woesearchaeota archaeon]